MRTRNKALNICYAKLLECGRQSAKQKISDGPHSDGNFPRLLDSNWTKPTAIPGLTAIVAVKHTTVEEGADILAKSFRWIHESPHYGKSSEATSQKLCLRGVWEIKSLLDIPVTRPIFRSSSADFLFIQYRYSSKYREVDSNIGLHYGAAYYHFSLGCYYQVSCGTPKDEECTETTHTGLMTHASNQNLVKAGKIW